MRGTYLGRGRMLIWPTWGGKLIVPADDLSLSPDLIIGGEIETPLTRYFQRAVHPGQVVADVGANVGYHTILLGAQVGSAGRVFAYEPNPHLLPVLRENIALNYFHDRVRVIPKAAHEAAGRVTLHCTRRYMGNSSLHPFADDYRTIDEVEDVEVEAEPLDALLAEAPALDLLKMDIEGSEYRALRGAGEMLRRKAVRTIVFELNRGRLQGDWEPFGELLERLRSEGWAFFTLTPEGHPEPTSVPTLLSRGYDSHVVAVC